MKRTPLDDINDALDGVPKTTIKKHLSTGKKVLIHDDDCGEVLNADGLCPKCQFYPDMQSTSFREV